MPDEVRQPDTLTVEANPLTLDLDDDVLVQVIDDRIKNSRDFYEDKLKLYERQKSNKDYLFGNQVNEDKLKPYQARYMDNISYEAEATIKPIAMSRLPDLLVKPGSDSEESKEVAKNITLAINSDIRKRENRSVLGLSFKHLPVYLIGAIKIVWDPQMGDHGDYRFKVVHPDNLVLDHTSSSKDSDDMDFIAEAMEISIKEATMRFPKKADELIDELVGTKLQSSDDKDNENKMASKIKIWEVWFTWWDAVMDEETGEKKWQKIDGVCWKYNKLVLGKMKHPYWDWEGKKRLFKYELDKKQELSEEEVRKMLFGEEIDGVSQDQFYFNHLKNPSKPYYFMGYDQWGENPYDFTSRIEQIRYMQDNINKRGRQITEMNDRAKGKHVFSADSGVDKNTIEAMDMANPDEDILIDGDVRMFHTFIPGQPAPAQLYEEQGVERQKAFSKAGAHSTTRGEKQSDVATTNQILREADFGRIDDLVEETINPAAEWMANWAMQMIKLFYTKDHMRKLVGQEGNITFMKINRDSIEDGMEVEVSASGVDKIERKREAFERAGMKLTDPLSFFMDTDASDPIGRTEKLMTFMLSPELYMQKYVMGRDSIDKMAQALFAQPVQGQSPPASAIEGQQQPIQTTATQGGAGGGSPFGGFQLMDSGQVGGNSGLGTNSMYQVQNSPLNK